MGGDEKIFTLAQVSEHNSPKDCWLVINGKDLKTNRTENICVVASGSFELTVTIGLMSGSYPNITMVDVTNLLEDHPGGDEVLLSATGTRLRVYFLLYYVYCLCYSMVLKRVHFTGKDATDDFEDVGHSDSARDYVGEINVSTIPKKIKYKPANQPHYNQDKTSEFIIKLLQFLVPLAILGLAVTSTSKSS
ncbi:Cytochrome b5 isoform B [Hibiscus syriacus]|uniref:Cytochrome b5 isoform B n=1 Tax=Hibiscus syriacus TaxID=106335 RepID=A0A6A3CFE4_HIBSY|nr:Cytochrome b5 isoform B [Hibiscus syriacus]